jgi:hypothetical protein
VFVDGIALLLCPCAKLTSKVKASVINKTVDQLFTLSMTYQV